MKIKLGIFTWQDIIRYQDQNIDLNFIANDVQLNPTDYKAVADYKGRIRALPIHLPYIKQHYKSVSFDKSAQKVLHEFNIEI